MGPCVQGLPCDLKSLEAGASSGQMWPGSHVGGPPPLIHNVLRTGSGEAVIFPEANGRSEGFHQGLGILPGNRELPGAGLKSCVWA